MLTRSQMNVLTFITEFIKKNHYAPTTTEIAAGIGISSRGVVYRYLQALAGAQHIKLLPNRRRNIQLINHKLPGYSLRLLGKISAGMPIEVVVDEQLIDVSRVFLGENRFALKVCGDSMVGEGILDGDLVVCEHAQQARSGQIVVALVQNSQATLKRISFPSSGVVRLKPENPDYLPQEYPASEVQVQGIYIGLLRIPD